MTVSAIDGGGRRTSLPITIYLNDTNDNRPKFRYNSYRIGLLENRKTFSDGKEDLEIQVNKYMYIATYILQNEEFAIYIAIYIVIPVLKAMLVFTTRNIDNTLIIYVL